MSEDALNCSLVIISASGHAEQLFRLCYSTVSRYWYAFLIHLNHSRSGSEMTMFDEAKDKTIRYKWKTHETG
jgi:hypothetical protein